MRSYFMVADFYALDALSGYLMLLGAYAAASAATILAVLPASRRVTRWPCIGFGIVSTFLVVDLLREHLPLPKNPTILIVPVALSLVAAWWSLTSQRLSPPPAAGDGATSWASRQGHRLLQIGMLLFLMALLVGLLIPELEAPRLGLSTHLLGIMQGLFLMVAGLMWGRLRVTRMTARVGCALAVYGCVAAWLANLFAAILGAGNSMLPIAAGSARGSDLDEAIITVALRSAAVSLIAAVLLILWGLRSVEHEGDV